MRRWLLAAVLAVVACGPPGTSPTPSPTPSVLAQTPAASPTPRSPLPAASPAPRTPLPPASPTPAGLLPAPTPTPAGRFPYSIGRRPVGPPHYGHTNHTATVLQDGRVLIVAGGDESEFYEPGGRIFTDAPPLPAAPRRQGHTATVLRDGRILVVGGLDEDDTCLADAALYDPLNETWAPAGRMAAARFEHSATPLGDGRVLVAGGTAAGCGSPEAELFDPTTGRWESAGRMGARRAEHSATLLGDGRVLVAGGYDSAAGGHATATGELYNPTANRWVPAAPMATARAGHIAAPLPGGEVLVAGGFTQRGENPPEVVPRRPIEGILDAAERYDPAAGRWRPAAAMSSPHAGHTVTAMPWGWLLVAGGAYPSAASSLPGQVELYHPGQDRWRPWGFLEGRHGHTASLLADGDLLLVGGGSAGADLLEFDLPAAGPPQPQAGRGSPARPRAPAPG